MNRTNPSNLPIHISPHHLNLSPSLRAFVSKKLDGLSHVAIDALSANVVLRRHHGTSERKQFSASARLALPGGDLHASSTQADLYSAVVKLVARLARLSRKRKTRLAKSYIKRCRALNAGAKVRPFPDKTDASISESVPFASVRIPRNRQGG